LTAVVFDACGPPVAMAEEMSSLYILRGQNGRKQCCYVTTNAVVPPEDLSSACDHQPSRAVTQPARQCYYPKLPAEVRSPKCQPGASWPPL
jgi:hypothetical protein